MEAYEKFLNAKTSGAGGGTMRGSLSNATEARILSFAGIEGGSFRTITSGTGMASSTSAGEKSSSLTLGEDEEPLPLELLP